MISIIVSSYREELFLGFAENVKKTIGLMPYEIVQINNPNIMSIGEAYNDGMMLAKFPYLVFAHEDILFTCIDWGYRLISIFQHDPKIGLVGVAGTQYKPWLYSGWNLLDSKSVFNFIDPCNEIRGTPAQGRDTFLETPTPFVAEVVAVDGLFLASPSDISKQVSFADYLKGFHCYDIDYSLSTGLVGYKVVVTSAISIYHSSLGSFNDSWIDATLCLHERRQSLLPACVTSNLHKDFILQEEMNAFRAIRPVMRHSKRLLFLILRQIYSPKFIRVLGSVNWVRFQRFLICSFVGLLSKS